MEVLMGFVLILMAVTIAFVVAGIVGVVLLIKGIVSMKRVKTENKAFPIVFVVLGALMTAAGVIWGIPMFRFFFLGQIS